MKKLLLLTLLPVLCFGQVYFTKPVTDTLTYIPAVASSAQLASEVATLDYRIDQLISPTSGITQAEGDLRWLQLTGGNITTSAPVLRSVLEAAYQPDFLNVSGRVDTAEASISNVTERANISVTNNQTDLTLSGNGAGWTNVNAELLKGYTIDQIMAVGATYYFATNEITYGAVTGRIATLSVPTTNQEAIYLSGYTNGQYLASYLIPSNEMPAILVKGIYSFKFNGYHEGNKNPTLMADLYIKTASNGVLVQEFESMPVAIPASQSDFYLTIAVTNDVPRDGYAFQLRTKIVTADNGGTLHSFFGKGYYSGFTIPQAQGLFATASDVAPVAASVSNQAVIMTKTLEPTGWEDCDNISVSYDPTSYIVTLTNTSGLAYWWRGTRYDLGTAWTSTAHSATSGVYYLAARTNSTIEWSTNVWTFDMLQVASASKDGWICAARETHGLMQWQVHEELHQQVGTYRVSGLSLGNYALNSQTYTSKAPSVASGIIQDEDLETYIEGTPAGGPYTLLYFTNVNSSVMLTGQTNLAVLTGLYGMLNTNNGTQFFTSSIPPSVWVNYYFIHIPVTTSTNSQQYRTVILQPQATFTSLALAQAEDFRGLNLGDLPQKQAEYVAYARCTFECNSGNSGTPLRTRLQGVSYLAGNKQNQVTVTGAGGQFITSVQNDTNLAGIASVSNGVLSIGTNDDDSAYFKTNNTDLILFPKDFSPTVGSSVTEDNIIYCAALTLNNTNCLARSVFAPLNGASTNIVLTPLFRNATATDTNRVNLTIYGRNSIGSNTTNTTISVFSTNGVYNTPISLPVPSTTTSIFVQLERAFGASTNYWGTNSVFVYYIRVSAK